MTMLESFQYFLSMGLVCIRHSKCLYIPLYFPLFLLQVLALCREVCMLTAGEVQLHCCGQRSCWVACEGELRGRTITTYHCGEARHHHTPTRKVFTASASFLFHSIFSFSFLLLRSFSHPCLHIRDSEPMPFIFTVMLFGGLQ